MSPIPCLLAVMAIAGAVLPLPAMGRSVRILTLGEPPPFRQEVRDGVRYEIDPPAEWIPPRVVRVGSGEDAKAGVRLQLGRISLPLAVPEGSGPLAIRSTAADAGADPWMQVTRPETGDFLIVAWRPPGQDTWSRPVHLIVPDGKLAPEGSVRVINVFPQAVSIEWSGENTLLEPGKSLVKTVAEAASVPFAVRVTGSDGRPKRYFSTSVTRNAGERGWILLYRADGQSPRRPLKVTVLREGVGATGPDPAPGSSDAR